jgi:hypothetical protein
MKWYIVKIIFRIICGEGQHAVQFDKQLRLISAQNEKEAFEKAKITGAREEDSFLNSELKRVKWAFVGITELKEIKEFGDGLELYSVIEEADDAERTVQTIRQKEIDIETSLLSLAVNKY